MQHSELLHRFFDEGLDEPLEDVLFGQMALDPDLRREFTSHLKLHSIIQEDVAGITTPSHVSQHLFTSLGLIPPASPQHGTSGFRYGAGAAWLKLRSLVVAHRRYLYTAVLSALGTAVLLLNFIAPPVELIDDGEVATHDAAARTIDITSGPAAPPTTGRASMAVADLRAEQRSETKSAAFANVIVPGSAAPSSIAPGSAAASDLSELPSPLVVNVLPGGQALEARLQNAMTDVAGIEISAVPEIDAPWKFFQPGPHQNLLSNLVFELRKVYGTSFPEVDLPHNSFTVFQNMAINVVYKTTEHHAFGFEYGRENFGREFQRNTSVLPVQLSNDPSSAQIYRPPAQWVSGPQRENRMLDVFGAVWKLSLPEYGLFDIVYPYMHTFVGATKLGPLGKVRAGLEMYPSNFSMLNVGVEGGMLRYAVDDMSYYTAKLNFTFGLAIGF